MRKPILPLLAGATVLAAAFALLPSGCDRAERMQTLTVSPSYVVMPFGTNSVFLTAVGGPSNALALPLEWSVSDPALGYVAGSSGYGAFYIRRVTDGDNTVRVRDQYGNEGFATVHQTPASSAAPILRKTQADAKTWTLTIVNAGEGPYQWWVSTPTNGTITTEGNESTAVYESREPVLPNEVYARDPDGAVGGIAIP